LQTNDGTHDDDDSIHDAIRFISMSMQRNHANIHVNIHFDDIYQAK
jgi:hypothetical protein